MEAVLHATTINLFFVDDPPLAGECLNRGGPRTTEGPEANRTVYYFNHSGEFFSTVVVVRFSVYFLSLPRG